MTLAVDGRPVDAGPARQSCVLAVLALQAREPVPMETLIDRVWGESPPSAVRSSLYGYATRLRRLLAGRAPILRHGGGYLLDLDPEEVDVHRMRSLADQGRRAARAGDEAEAVRRWRAAVDLWHGVPLAGVNSDWAVRVRDALLGERLTLLVDLYGAELHAGRHAEVVGELSQLVAEYPLGEPLVGAYMLALHRCGRTPEALGVFATIRERLRDELGSDPGPALLDLQRQLLSGGPAPERPRDRVPVPRQLPADIASFAGRAAELRELDLLADAGPTIAVITGAGGTGKTALALHWAHRAAHRYPDGQLFVDLRGYAEERPLAPAEVLGRFLRALGSTDLPAGLDERSALLRSLLAGTRRLLVLDNAASPAQLRPLLPGTGTCGVVVTSRADLRGLATTHDLRSLGVDALPAAEAEALLDAVLGADRSAAEPGATRDLADLCGHLPLALRLAAAQLAVEPDRPVGDLVAALRRHTALTVLTVEDDRSVGLRATFALSYRVLRPDAQQLFRYLGLNPGAEPGLAALAALRGRPGAEIEPVLARLAVVHLADRDAAGRWHVHDLLRTYAAELAAEHDAEPDRRAALTRQFEWYLSAAHAAMDLVDPDPRREEPGCAVPAEPLPALADRDGALAWLEGEYPNLLATIRVGAEGRYPGVWRMARILCRFLVLRGYLEDWITVSSEALDAARELGDAEGEAVMLVMLGNAYNLTGEPAASLDYCRQTLDAARRLGDRRLEACALASIGSNHRTAGRYAEAAEHYRAAYPLFEADADHMNAAGVLTELGVLAAQRGLHADALDHQRRALELGRLRGYRILEAVAHSELGQVHLRLGWAPEAGRHLRAALAIHTELGDRPGEALATSRLGLLSAHLGLAAEALAHHAEALDLSRRHGSPQLTSTVLNDLAETRRSLGDHDGALAAYAEALDVAAAAGELFEAARAEGGTARVLLAAVAG